MIALVWKMAAVGLLVPFALHRHHVGEFVPLAIILAFYALGDGLIEFSMVAGALAFAAGHLVAIWLYFRHRRVGPTFSQKLLAIVIFLLTQVFPIFQPVSMVLPGMGFWDKLQAIALPVIVLVMVVLAHMMRMTRAAILNVMQSAYVETAELKGLGPMQVVWRHALPNAIAPVVSVVMLNLAYLVVGVVVVEVVFSYNALGKYLVDHVTKRDLPVVQACGMIFAAVYIGLNILADVVSILANPRLRHPK
mgnify:CR=1 FL=1